MSLENNKEKGHSENYFGDYRDFWWNNDFLDLMAKRLKLNRHKSMLDVGCGMCHWSKLLVKYLDSPPEVYGVDKDVKWSEDKPELHEYFNSYKAKFELRNGDAEALPFEDNSFDFVTCQTVLIHLNAPKQAIAEMKRVLKPGGTILCVEPNNIIQNLTKSSLIANDSLENILDHVKYALICERGKKKLGEGDNSLGDLVPGFIAEAGFENIDVYLSDKAIAMYPPYNTPEQKAALEQWEAGNTWGADTNSDLKYFLAFDTLYLDFYKKYQEKYLYAGERFRYAISSQRYHAGGGSIMYLISGTKKYE